MACMSTPYHELALRMAELIQEAGKYPLGGFTPVAPASPPAPGAPTVMLCSPHPDDECIVGGLAVRLQREAGARVMNVAVTLGSNRERQQGRLEELGAACRYLGFELVTTGPRGLEKVNLKSRAEDPEGWRQKVATLRDILVAQQPDLLIFPHHRDWNSTHIGVHHLVMDALEVAGGAVQCLTVETEFWGAMDDPNLMVEVPPALLGDLMAATSFHVGEVRRNPYHVLLPAWMQDNVRRGGELVGGQGGAAPDFVYATLYRFGRWTGSQWEKVQPPHRILAAGISAGCLLEAV